MKPAIISGTGHLAIAAAVTTMMTAIKMITNGLVRILNEQLTLSSVLKLYP